MANDYQTQSSLLSLYADNSSGAISAQDLRDGVVSWQTMPGVVPVSGAHGGGTGTRADRATAVGNAITDASNNSLPFVLVTSDYLDYDASAVTFDNSVRMLREGQVGDVYDVTAYGAAGDGTTDDTAACQAAHDASRDGEFAPVYYPAGTFLVSGLTTADPFGLIGAGRSATTIKLADSSDGVLLATENAGGNEDGWLTIRDVTFDGNKANQTGSHHGLNLDVFQLALSRVVVADASGDGIHITGTGNENRLHMIRVLASDGDGIQLGAPDCLCTNITCGNNGTAALRFTKGSHQISNFHLWSGGQADSRGIIWQGDDITLANGLIESFDRDGILVNPTSAVESLNIVNVLLRDINKENTGHSGIEFDTTNAAIQGVVVSGLVHHGSTAGPDEVLFHSGGNAFEAVVTGCAFYDYQVAATDLESNGGVVAWGPVIDEGTFIPPKQPNFTVSGLPASPQTGAVAYATDGRKNGEGAGSGTGVLVFFDGSNWIAVDTGQTVAA